jgi:hypothetical protein
MHRRHQAIGFLLHDCTELAGELLELRAVEHGDVPVCNDRYRPGRLFANDHVVASGFVSRSQSIPFDAVMAQWPTIATLLSGSLAGA